MDIADESPWQARLIPCSPADKEEIEKSSITIWIWTHLYVGFVQALSQALSHRKRYLTASVTVLTSTGVHLEHDGNAHHTSLNDYSPSQLLLCLVHAHVVKRK